MPTLNIHEAKTKLSAVLADVQHTGTSYIICRRGKPVAELSPLRKKTDRLTPHPTMGRIKLHYDPIEPLRPDDWPEDA